jgi:hypothetical protein
VTYVAIGQGGDPNRVVYGTDLDGNTCGISEAVKDKPFAAWPFPLVRVSAVLAFPSFLAVGKVMMSVCAQEYSAQICVASCDETLTDSSRMAVRYPRFDSRGRRPVVSPAHNPIVC